jgi:natural product biosynthesis luciferase-like monooxygenase protein
MPGTLEPWTPRNRNAKAPQLDRSLVMGTSLDCVLIGRGTQLTASADMLLGRGHRVICVVSDCSLVAAWAQKHGITRVESNGDYTTALNSEPFDYLFSIVNHDVTPASVLALPRNGAINYHDSLLPAYGGFHATTWSILDGQTEHGVTWHRMTKDVDAGDYLVQAKLAIADDDTAFSLATKAGGLALRTFAELLDKLERGVAETTPGLPVQQFHRKSDRPGYAVLDWAQPAQQLMKLVRALDFGSEDSWLTRAKVETPSGQFLLIGAAKLMPSANGLQGEIHQVNASVISVQAVDGMVLISDLTTLEGESVGEQDYPSYGLVAGGVMPQRVPKREEDAASFDKAVTTCERFWVGRLRGLSIPQFAELSEQEAVGATQRLEVPLSPAVLTCSPEDRRAMLIAGLAVYAARVGGEGRVVDIPMEVSSLAAPLSPLYSATVPLRLAFDGDASWQDVLKQAKNEVGLADRRGTFARDVWPRYAALRSKSASEKSMTVAAAFTANSGVDLPPGVRLRIALPDAADCLELTFDANALGSLHAERIGCRIANLLQAAVGDVDVEVSRLPAVTDSESKMLLHAFQDTHRDSGEVACIHDLFVAQACRTPDKVALAYRDESVTYRELDERSDVLADHLRGLGVSPDRLVAIAIERSIEMVVGLLGILKAGGAYVPLDPAYPAERLAMMLEDSGARWLLTQQGLQSQLPKHDAQVVLIEAVEASVLSSGPATTESHTAAAPSDLAYVIFTSGSTGRPKGVMVEHRNVSNFFAGMDEVVGQEPGIWLAVTSISFDISVLEIFWTLSRGFETVIQEEGDRASLLKSQSDTAASETPMGFGLFYFAADSSSAGRGDAYSLLLDGARFADAHDFVAVWTPERHFHAFGGLYPNPAVTSAALAAITDRIELRAGSVVLPLHDPIRVAEEWAVVDNLSNGRVGLSFASGWHVDDFVLKPQNFERRREVMQESIDTVLRLWAGEKVKVPNGAGDEIEVGVLPRPIRERPPMWIASAGNIETFRAAGRSGHNILTNMLGQNLEDLTEKFAAYREARRDSGHEGDGIVSVMLHTFVTDSDERAREVARGPFGNYLKTSYDLVKVAPWMFPAFKQPSAANSASAGRPEMAFDADRFDDDDMAALLDHAFDRYFDTAGLFGTPQRALRLVEQLKKIGASEVACLVDFGIDSDVVLKNLKHLDELRQLANPVAGVSDAKNPISIREQFARRPITHFQCTPSMARILSADGTLGEMKTVRRFLVGGEALTADLAQQITTVLPEADLINMYGPTETTVWSTTEAIDKEKSADITIGKPIVNTQIRILDRDLALQPLGTPGELCIGGAGVVRGYFNRPDLTAERFVPDPYLAGGVLYRTGDLARYRESGTLEYLGRLDQQVKVNGYRIELGEIETVLQRHPAVKQAVVSVKERNGQSQLIGYVIPAGGTAAAGDVISGDRDDWQSLWDTAYATRAGAGDAPARFDTSGWLSSYTGEPIAAEAMREWLDQTTQRILGNKPTRVLEIGCGTGMILYSCLDKVEHYTAVDVSSVALESIRAELSESERQKVVLLNRAADQLESVAAESCDMVVINSVAQYFPNAEYLLGVLKQAARVLTSGGTIFLGDVRSLETAPLFHAVVECQKAPGQTAVSALAGRVEERQALDTELLLAKSFFMDVASRIPGLQLVSMQAKRGVHPTEMRDFRCDVVLRFESRETELDVKSVAELTQPESVEEIRQALASAPPVLMLRGVRNARLDCAGRVLEAIQQRDATASVDSLLKLLNQDPEGVDPEDVYGISDEYDVELRFGDEATCFDALLRRRGDAPAGVWPLSETVSGATSSTPYQREGSGSIVPKLRLHLQDFLPDYMVPTAIVLLDSLPLTPNGKTDRNALPVPEDKSEAGKSEYAVPVNDLEKAIADIWGDILSLERVSRKDNIFELGASSLLTVEANSRLQAKLDRKVPLVTMFRYPTIESLADHLAGGAAKLASGNNSASNSDRQNRMDSAAQRRREARARKR